MGSMGIRDLSIFETPLAVIDFETTGLTAGYDRVVEVSVVRIDPGRPPQLVFDSLINPNRSVAATEVHGITDDDVRDAPTFADVAEDIREVLAQCVVTAYNVYFDIAFLDYELKSAGMPLLPPYMCVMYLRPLLNLGKRCSLSEACRAHSIPFEAKHRAGDDGLAAATLLCQYLEAIRSQGIRTYGELARLKSYKFFDSFEREPCAACGRQRSPGPRKSRRVGVTATKTEAADVPVTNVVNAVASYWDTLKTVLSDLEVSDEEIEALRQSRVLLNLADDQVRALHARAFMSVMSQFTSDARITDRERGLLKRVLSCLSRAGWAPGE